MMNAINILINSIAIYNEVCYNIQKEVIMETLYTVRQVAKMLGVAQVTVRKWIEQDKIKSVKVVGSRRISHSEIDRIVKEE